MSYKPNIDCKHLDIERGDEFTADRCRSCFAQVFPARLRGSHVWPMVISYAETEGWHPSLISMMRERNEHGIAKYGEPLCARGDAPQDTAKRALQKLLDLIVYLKKLDIEGAEWSRGDLIELESLAYRLVVLSERPQPT